ncbi:hypothetical protein [Calothrix sp. PCC 7507]|uniref:hypothetical protein n=1 Tax=Calothrix sp. PCC 7507 TaxID=99598 RepID=UPI00029F0C9D|nr:hypothetical protein [Calothrix sp. PCC 7507]AFY32343.1 hypothetical protein Cal7507_1894 [Calothrix sp. PCC 7507]
MNSPLGTRIFTVSTTLLLSAIFLTTLQTPSSANPAPTIRDSQILPYLLDNPNDNSVVKVRCIPQQSREVDRNRRFIRDSLLQSNSGDGAANAFGERNQNITIEIEGSCRNVRIRVQDDANFSDFPVYNPYLDRNHPESNDSWLTREGSGWYWLLHRR